MYTDASTKYFTQGT